MIYKIYTSRYEIIKFLYGLGKGHQQFTNTTAKVFIQQFHDRITVIVDKINGKTVI